MRGTETVVHDSPELRIVDQVTWEQVKALQAEKYTGGRPGGRGQVRPLTGLAFCPECGGKLWVQASRNAKGVYYYLECSRRRTSGAVVCGNGMRVREDVVVGDFVRRLLLLVDLEGRVVELATARAIARAKERQADVADVRSRLGELQRKSARLADLVADESLDADGRRALLSQLGVIERERQSLQGETAL